MCCEVDNGTETLTFFRRNGALLLGEAPGTRRLTPSRPGTSPSLYTGTNFWSDTQGANALTLGKAAVGAPYSAAVYVSGVINGQWGVWVSDNAGSTWTRFNDDAHQFGGVGKLAGDWNTYGRIYAAGRGRGVLYSN